MKLFEALEKYKRVRRKCWHTDSYVMWSETRTCSPLVGENNSVVPFNSKWHKVDDWEEYPTPLDLLPCPICGAQPITKVIPVYTSIKCHKRGRDAHRITIERSTTQEAKYAWNDFARRVVCRSLLDELKEPIDETDNTST